ncbi:MAG: hypothetical protein ABIP20_06045 [Chthoniobacteraceae bacterium]
MAALSLAAWMWVSREADPVTMEEEPSVPISGNVNAEPESPSTAVTETKPEDSRRDEPPAAEPTGNFQRIAVVRTRADKVLATVNDEPIHLRDLMPIAPAETEKEMTREQYDSRLDRAIGMELVFQNARAEGVALTGAQQQRMDEVAAVDQASQNLNNGLILIQTSPNQIEFESRLLVAQMLEQNLVAKKADLAPSPDAEIQSRYEKARREFLEQLRAQAKISRSAEVR